MNFHFSKNSLFLFLGILIFQKTFSQTDSIQTQFLTPSINELTNAEKIRGKETKVSVASLIDIEKNEAPGVITIITSQDIEAIGARDLIDVLSTIPGFNLASDVQNGLAFGIRGNWAEEGKILYMIDGMYMNELAYGSYVVGNRFPINSIDKIEIIRGAGSALYGGLAGLGVINIITKQGQKLNGHKIFVNGGTSTNNISRAGLNYNFGGTLLNGAEISICAMSNFGNRSNLSVQLPDSEIVGFKDSSQVTNQMFYLNFKKNNFAFKHLMEDYNFQSTFEPIHSLTRTLLDEINYTYTENKFSITPTFRYKWQLPWNTQYGNPILYGPQNTVTQRTNLGFTSSYNFNINYNLSLGGNLYNDGYKYFYSPTQIATGVKRNYFFGYSVFGELFLNLKFTKMFIGLRYDKYNDFKSFWSPRLTASKSYKHFFYKALANVSYKLPTIQNIVQSDTAGIKPEIIREMQFQLGYYNKNFEISSTFFHNKLNRLIVFFVDSLQNESYKNRGKMNTRGIETEIKWKIGKLKISANHSFYQPFNSTSSDVLIDKSNEKLGTFSFPLHKLYFGFSYQLNKDVTINIFETFLSKKTIVAPKTLFHSSGAIELKNENNINITCQIQNLFDDKLKLNFGLYNILNTKNYYGYAYKSGYQPMIGMGRELFFQLKYSL